MGRARPWAPTTGETQPSGFGHLSSTQPLGSVFSPDGRWVAYTYSPTDDVSTAQRGIFVQPFPANGTRFQVPRQNVDFHPMWDIRGRELVFMASTAQREMAAVAVSGGADRPLFASATPFPASVAGGGLSASPRAFDLLPDGRLIGLVTQGAPDPFAAAARGVRVVLNWFDALKQRVPVP